MREIKVSDAAADYIELYRNDETLKNKKAVVCDLITDFIFEQQAGIVDTKEYLLLLSDYVDLLNELSKTE